MQCATITAQLQEQLNHLIQMTIFVEIILSLALLNPFDNNMCEITIEVTFSIYVIFSHSNIQSCRRIFSSSVSLAAPYYFLIFFIGLRPKLGNTYYHIIREYDNEMVLS
jgi:hypothetical protein